MFVICHHETCLHAQDWRLLLWNWTVTVSMMQCDQVYLTDPWCVLWAAVVTRLMQSVMVLTIDSDQARVQEVLLLTGQHVSTCLTCQHVSHCIINCCHVSHWVCWQCQHQHKTEQGLELCSLVLKVTLASLTTVLTPTCFRCPKLAPNCGMGSLHHNYILDTQTTQPVYSAWRQAGDW